MRRTALHEVFTGHQPVTEKKEGKKAKKPKKKTSSPDERLTRRSIGETGKSIDPPAGTLPAPEDGEPKPWELSPEELRSQMTAALWPAEDGTGVWVPRQPLTLSQYLQHGV